jgi:hypothetical protein
MRSMEQIELLKLLSKSGYSKLRNQFQAQTINDYI